MKSTHDIPATNFAHLKSQIEKLNHRAPRLGCDPITLTVLREYSKERVSGTTSLPYTQARMEIEVVGESPQMEGWRFLAIVQPLSNGENLVRCVPGCTVPTSYRDTGMHCDHCNTNRRRNEVFILGHMDGWMAQVGRTCIKDFLGHVAADVLASRAEYCIDAYGLAEEAESDHYRSQETPSCDISEYLGTVAICIRRLGWLSKAQAGEYTPTSQVAWDVLFDLSKFTAELIEKNNLQAEERDVKLAEATLEWATALNEQHDYLYNLGVACRQELVTDRTKGLVASAITAYQRHLEKFAQVKEERKLRGHVGEIGKREDFEVVVKRLRYFDGNWGVTTFALFEDSNGNHILWKASKELDLEEGDTVTLRATVKKHGEYKGVPQTEVSRGAIS